MLVTKNLPGVIVHRIWSMQIRDPFWFWNPGQMSQNKYKYLSFTLRCILTLQFENMSHGQKDLITDWEIFLGREKWRFTNEIKMLSETCVKLFMKKQVSQK